MKSISPIEQMVGAWKRLRDRQEFARIGLSAILLLLVLPGFVYPYLYDDFDFLVRALKFRASNLFPDPTAVFYRPVSRDLYFGLLQWLSPNGPMLGHALNAVAVILACLICATIAARFLGRRGGVIAGLLFAGCGQVPLLVTWVSGCQDALAIVFALGALLFEIKGKHGVALALAAFAVLSKETAVSVLPAIALASYYLSPSRRSPRSRVFDYALVLVLWAAIHPGIHLLLNRGFRSGGVEYVGLDNVDWIGSLGRYAALLLNVPPLGMSAVWPSGLTLSAVLATAAGSLLLLATPTGPGAAAGAGRGGSAFLATAFAAMMGPLLLTSFLLRHWAPYYAAFPAVGVAWLLAAGLVRLPKLLQVGTVAAYIAAGVGMRGLAVDVTIPTEQNLALAASALNQLEPQFLTLQPSMEPNAQVLIASQVQGAASVHVHLYTFQVFRQWYRSAAIRVVRPELRLPDRPAEYLFWINRDLNVFQIDLGSLLPRSVRVPARFSEYQGVIRAYTRGLAESNELDRATQILLRMPEPDREHWWWDRRIAASYLLAFGRRAEAVSLLQSAPPVEQDLAIDLSVELLAQPTKTPRYDSATLEAFGLDEHAPEVVEKVMERLAATRDSAAPRFAVRLLALRPGDPSALAVIRAFERRTPAERITPAQPQG